MAKKNTDFRLGLDRKSLIEAAQIYGKSEQSAKKSNTKNLEKFVMRHIPSKGTEFPELSAEDKRDISDNAKAWGVRDALKRLTYRVEKLGGLRNDENFLRLTIHDSFSLYYTGKGQVTPEHVDELISKLPNLASTQVDSDMINIRPFYRNLFISYNEELQQKEAEKAEQQKEAV